MEMTRMKLKKKKVVCRDIYTRRERYARIRVSWMHRNHEVRRTGRRSSVRCATREVIECAKRAPHTCTLSEICAQRVLFPPAFVSPLNTSVQESSVDAESTSQTGCHVSSGSS
eukprot:6257029-Prymnesium_polylepis.1